MRDEGKSMELLPHKSIITQVEKTQFDYDIVAASVSAYSDRDCFSKYIYFFRFVFSENKKKTFKNFILQIYNNKKKNGSGTVTLFQLLFSCCFSCCYSCCSSITCLFLIVFFLQMEHLGIIILPKKKHY
jgi:hypothetical protein